MLAERAADLILEAEMLAPADSAVVLADAWQTTQRSIATG
jgi:choline dehydrogenase